MATRAKPGPKAKAAQQLEEDIKRITFTVSEKLHREIKVGCAQRGTTIADEVRALLEKHYGVR